MNYAIIGFGKLGQVQPLSNPQQFNRGPLEIRCEPAQVAFEFLGWLVQAHYS